jgi:hypothetical protein
MSECYCDKHQTANHAYGSAYCEVWEAATNAATARVATWLMRQGFGFDYYTSVPMPLALAAAIIDAWAESEGEPREQMKWALGAESAWVIEDGAWEDA